jgi:uncharacterized protein YdhG (YjbR/CyaY superfamily)
MQSKSASVDEYISQLPADRQDALQKLRLLIASNLKGVYEETISYGMIGYVVPKSVYPAGYHCNPDLPLPFISIASQKNFIALYHMGVYAQPDLYNWFVAEYPKHCKSKLDMGKSCIRFKKKNEIPFALIGELIAKMSTDEWVECYELNYKKHK